MHKFYQPSIDEKENHLPDEEAKHCIQVLRQREGDHVLIMDGKGGIHTALLKEVSKKQVVYEVISSKQRTKKNFHVHLAIAPTKNMDRMEWLIEKLTEIGVDQVSFIITKNSERKAIRLDRLEKKAISAMKQSGNPFLLKINQLIGFSDFISVKSDIKLIAHVDNEHQHISNHLKANKSILLLVGPEGDFTKEEVEMAVEHNFSTVSLGHNTLRTETAGLSACCYINFINQY